MIKVTSLVTTSIDLKILYVLTKNGRSPVSMPSSKESKWRANRDLTDFLQNVRELVDEHYQYLLLVSMRLVSGKAGIAHAMKIHSKVYFA